MIGVEELSLLSKSKINRDKTAQAVKDFFINDFDHYLNLSNMHLSDISSPTLDPNGVVAHDGMNHMEERMVINIDARACVMAVNQSIQSCMYKHAIIIYLYFIEGKSNDSIAKRLHYQTTQFHSVKKDALVEFAERFEYWRNIDNASVGSLCIFDNVPTI